MTGSSEMMLRRLVPLVLVAALVGCQRSSPQNEAVIGGTSSVAVESRSKEASKKTALGTGLEAYGNGSGGSGLVSPRPPPPRHREAPLPRRAAARRLQAAWPQELPVAYQPEPGLRWARLEAALARRPAEARVSPFSRVGTSRTELHRSGEVLALAAARQLSRVRGVTVLLQGFGADLDEAKGGLGGKKTGLVRSDGRNIKAIAPLAHLSLSGAGSFTIDQGSDHALARITAEVRFQAGPLQETISAAPIAVEVRNGEKLARSIRVQKAQQEALAEFVRKLFAQEQLEVALSAALTKVK